MNVSCTWVKLTDFQISGCESHQNAFAGQTLLGPAWGAIALPRPLAVIMGKQGRKKLGIGRDGKGNKERE